MWLIALSGHRVWQLWQNCHTGSGWVEYRQHVPTISLHYRIYSNIIRTLEPLMDIYWCLLTLVRAPSSRTYSVNVWMAQYCECTLKKEVRKRHFLPLNFKPNIKERCCAFMCAVHWHFDQRVTSLLRCFECVCFYVCSAVTFWPLSDCAYTSAYQFHPPGGDRICHTEWLTFHLPAPPQCPQVVPLCQEGWGQVGVLHLKDMSAGGEGGLF